MEPSNGNASKGSIYSLIGIIIISISVIVSSAVLAKGGVRFKTATEVVRVVGSASMPITSDLVIWDGTISRENPDLVTAYKGLKSDVSNVVAYLEKQGVKPDEISTKAIVTTGLYQQVKQNGEDGYDNSGDNGNQATFRKLIAYQLTENVEVRSNDVELVSKISREVTDLLATGVNFQSNPPEYLYTKVGEAKIQILQKAAADARKRAEVLAQSSGAHLGDVRYIHMSPLNISPRDSANVYSGGQYDTTSMDKTITAVVNLGISLN